MANRITRRTKALISGGLHPHYRAIIETTAHWQGYSAVDGQGRCRGPGRPDRPGRQGDLLRRRAEPELLRPCPRLHQARGRLPCRRRAADRGRDRGRVAGPHQAAGRDGRRHRGLRGPVDRQRAGLRRPLCRPVRHPRQVRAPDAGPAGRRDRRCRRQARLRADLEHARAAYPPREGDLQHLHQRRPLRARLHRAPDLAGRGGLPSPGRAQPRQGERACRPRGRGAGREAAERQLLQRIHRAPAQARGAGGRGAGRPAHPGGRSGVAADPGRSCRRQPPAAGRDRDRDRGGHRRR